MYTLVNARDILDSLIDGHPDDALGASLSEVLMFIRQQDSEKRRLRRALSFMEECMETLTCPSDFDPGLLPTLRSYAVKFIEGQIAIFVTSDGYELYYQSKKLEGSRDDCDLGPSEPAEGVWVDSLVPELQDNFWYGDMLGPWDTTTKERLEGRLES
jgi:hypothetical protein